MIDQALITAGLAAIADIVKALADHTSGQLSAEDARVQIKVATDKLASNDAAADTALDAKFKGA